MVPYLVAFISLENILIVTKSVMSTPSHLDSKIRVAQGLSLEGWNITKNLFAEITVLTVGFFVGILEHSIQVRIKILSATLALLGFHNPKWCLSSLFRNSVAAHLTRFVLDYLSGAAIKNFLILHWLFFV